MGNALYFVTMIDHRIVCCIAVVLPSTFTKIYVTGQFPEEKYVGPPKYFRTDAGCFQQFVKQLYRPEICVQAKFLPHLQQALFRPYFEGGVIVVLRMSYGAEQDGIGIAHLLEAFFRQRIASGLDSFVTDRGVVVYKFMSVCLGDMVQYVLAASGYLFSDAVAG